MRVYLDWNATSQPLPEVIDAMMAAARSAWANPSSVHGDGRAARAVVEAARAEVGALASANPRDVVFTAGATESNNLALVSAMHARQGRLITSRLEHPSITRVAERYEAEGRTRWLRVLGCGTVDLEDLERALAEAPAAAIAMQAVNHETGMIQPVAEVVALAKLADAWVHVDAAQAFGKVDDIAGDAHSRSIAPHKFRGPKGIGALVLRPFTKLTAVLVGGAQERGVRPGTVDAALAAGFGAAARHALTGPARFRAVAARRDRFEAALVALGAAVNGAGARAPHVSSLAWQGWRGPELVAALDLEGVSCSSGSACSAGTAEPSPVISAMSNAVVAGSSVRVSMGDATTDDELARAERAFASVVSRVK